MLKYAIETSPFFHIFSKVWINTIYSLSFKLIWIDFSIIIYILEKLRIYSFGYDTHHLLWKVYFKISLIKFSVIPTIGYLLIPSYVSIELLLKPYDSILWWILIILHTFNTTVPWVITQVFDHNLYDSISIWNHGYGELDVVLLSLFIDGLNLKWFLNVFVISHLNLWIVFEFDKLLWIYVHHGGF
jgi:hypothetical protein